VSGPSRRPFGRPFVPVPTGDESAAFDRWAIQELGVPQATLMENAGRGAAQLVQQLFPDGEVVAVVGAGNNGGDALVALRALAEWGRDVRALLVADRPDPEPVLHGWPLERALDARDGEAAWSSLAGAGVVLDGVLGTGIKGPPRERQAEAIRRVNASGRPVVALDVPSGVDANDGSVPGDAVRAELTVAFGWPKLGSLLHPARAHAGRLVALDIGFPPVPEGRFAGRLVTPGWASTLHPSRGPDTHKKAVGVVLIVAGRPGMAGAAVLAAGAALRSGAGLVRIASAPENREILQTAVPAAIFVDVSDARALQDAVGDSTAVAAGPGLGRDRWAKELLGRALAGGRAPLLLDADALNIVAEYEGIQPDIDLGAPPGPGAFVQLAGLTGRRPVLITPHAGEMVRLAPGAKEGLRSGRVPWARGWADRNGCVLLLKGSPSLVAAPGEPVLIDSVGSSDLATAGMGDVLSGVAVAFLAQGLAPRLAAALALQVSGRAARRAAKGRGLIPDDVVAHLPDALAERGEGSTDLRVSGLLFDQDAAH
jgi:NAD(P)H-hydrate epimerase